jgi:hypothetical protein
MVGDDAAVEDNIFVTPSSARSGKSATTRRLPHTEQDVYPGRREMPQPVTLLDPALTPPRSHPSRGQISYLLARVRCSFQLRGLVRKLFALTFRQNFSS